MWLDKIAEPGIKILQHEPRASLSPHLPASYVTLAGAFSLMVVVSRIPYTLPFPPPIIHPSNATTLPAAIAAVTDFLQSRNNVLLTGAGISVESGLADYRGEKGTYRLNQKFRPIYFAEFTGSHESRKRYWARSFLGWPTMENVRPNRSHAAISQLGKLDLASHVITQNVDSLHYICHPKLLTTELHGTLRTLTCLTCHSPYPRAQFQQTLARLNPKWADFLKTVTEASISDRDIRCEQSVKTNPDGDIELPGAPYTQFRYPPCPKCLEESPRGSVLVDSAGAHMPNPGGPTRAILKPSITFFGESVSEVARKEAEIAIENADSVLVLGSSLATYSAWRLVKAAHEKGIGVGIVNLGGVRGEDMFFAGGARGPRVRIEFAAGDVLSGVVKEVSGGLGDVDMALQADSLNGVGGVGLGG